MKFSIAIPSALNVPMPDKHTPFWYFYMIHLELPSQNSYYVLLNRPVDLWRWANLPRWPSLSVKIKKNLGFSCSSGTKSLWQIWSGQSRPVSKNCPCYLGIALPCSPCSSRRRAATGRPIPMSSAASTSATLHPPPPPWTSLSICGWRSIIRHPSTGPAIQPYLQLHWK